MLQRILIVDKDIRQSLFFLSNLATILHYMRLKMDKTGLNIQEFDFDFFKRKMLAYEVVYESLIENFDIDMFGEYSNSAPRSHFQLQLTLEGWKYFDLVNLNAFFSIKYQEQLDRGLISEEAALAMTEITQSYAEDTQRDTSWLDPNEEAKT